MPSNQKLTDWLPEDTMLLRSFSKHQRPALGKGERSLKLSSHAAYENQTKILSRGIVLFWNHAFHFRSLNRWILFLQLSTWNFTLKCLKYSVRFCWVQLSFLLSYPSPLPSHSSLLLLSHTAVKRRRKKSSIFSLAYYIFFNL